MKYKVPVIILAAILLVGGTTGYIVLQIQRQNTLARAESLLHRGEYAAVLDLFQESLADGSRRPSERLLTAKALYRQGQFDQALAVLEPLLRPRDEDPRALVLAGWIWIRKNSYIQAQTLFDKAANTELAAEAEGGQGAVALLRSERYRGDELNQAEFHLNQALSQVPDSPEIHLVLADLKALQHQNEEAINAARRAAELAPCWYEPYVMLGRVQLQAGHYAEAEKAFKEGLKYGADEEETNYYRARSIYFQGRLNETLVLLLDLVKANGKKSREALEDAAKITQILRPEEAVDYLQQAWAQKETLITGVQLYQTLSGLGKADLAGRILEALMGKWPFVNIIQLEQGHRLLKEGKLDEAYNAYQSALLNDASNFLAYYNLGFIALVRGQYFNAADFYNAAIRDYEDFFPAQVNLVLSQLAGGREMEAQSNLELLLKRFPDNLYLLLARALERFLAGDTYAALELAGVTQEQHPRQAAPHILRGEILLRLFQFDEARRNFEEALERDPGNIRARLGLAHALYRLGETEPAADLYNQLAERAQQLAPDLQYEIQNGLALVHLARQDHGEAVKVWEEIQNKSEWARQVCAINLSLMEEETPTDAVVQELKNWALSSNALPEAGYDMALFLHAMNRPQEAAEAYENVLKRFPAYLPALFNLANFYAQRGRYYDAIALFERARHAAPGQISVLNNEAAVCAQVEDSTRAETLITEAVQLDPLFSDIRFNQMLLTLEQGDVSKTEKAFTDFQKDFQAASRSQQAALNLIAGLILGRKEKWGEAAPAFARAADNDSHNAYAALNQGIALAKLKRYSEAETALRRAIRQDPALADAHQSLGLLYCELGLYEDAVSALEESLRLDPARKDVEGIVRQIQEWMRDDRFIP
ncbi:MAG: tetratricopeptide repeat protein [Candidatus Omnitrophica bacterium]|nr:tetratricopeptide repeat protein [Candidatus Omnitrophota bacterium]